MIQTPIYFDGSEYVTIVLVFRNTVKYYRTSMYILSNLTVAVSYELFQQQATTQTLKIMFD